MIIRKAENKDVSSIFQLENSCFVDFWSEKTIKESMENANYHYFVLQENGEIIGYFSVTCVEKEIELLRIAVFEKHRNKGYGQLMMNKLLEFSKENGADKIFLEVRASNTPAIKMYSKNGFIEYMRRKNYYQGVEDAVLFLCELRGE